MKQIQHLAVAGVNSWRYLLPLPKDMEVKTVNIAFDMDAIANHTVAFYLKAIVHK